MHASSELPTASVSSLPWLETLSCAHVKPLASTVYGGRRSVKGVRNSEGLHDSEIKRRPVLSSVTEYRKNKKGHSFALSSIGGRQKDKELERGGGEKGEGKEQ